MRKVIRRVLKNTELIDRGRYVKGAALGTLGFCTRSAAHIEEFRPQWLEVTETDLHLQDLDHQLHGIRIAHISDIHHGRAVTGEYLRRCFERINMLDVDLVVVTGDYITYDIYGRYREKVIPLLAGIQSRFGIYACLGNHDYGLRSMSSRRRNSLLRQMTRGMQANGITVLRNESIVLDIDGYPLWLVGLGDLREGDFHPQSAFADIPEDEATIALVHNPRGVDQLHEFGVHAVVSGHTHGVKARIPAGRILNFKSRRFHAGMYNVKGVKLYVNRGLGRVGRLRLNARPEITVHTLC